MKQLMILIVTLSLLLSNSSCTPYSAEAGNAETAMQISRAAVPEKQAPEEYVIWVDDKNNGLKVEKTIEDFTYALHYKPLEYVALQELKKDSVSARELKETMERYSGLQYFTFRISTGGTGELLKKKLVNTNDYYARIQYYSFDMQKDLKLIEGIDTLECMLFHFERTYGVAPYATFVLGFPLTDGKQDKTLVYDEKIFGAGRIYLTIQAKNYKKLPSVITARS